tara:strand:+ start:228 stop:422 length:195 start_codon:yes stop_codon:yes gene_type:complete
MKVVEMILFMAIVNGSPSKPEPVQEASVIVAMEDVKKKKKKGKKIGQKGKKKKKGFWSKVFGTK